MHVTSSVRPTTQPCSLRVCLSLLAFNPSFSTLVVTRSTPFYFQPSSPAHRAPILTAEDSRIARITSADVKPQKTAAPRSTRRTQPLTNRPSVWTTSLSGKGFTLYRFIQVTVRTFLCLFCGRPLLSILHLPILLLSFILLLSYVASPSPSLPLSRT